MKRIFEIYVDTGNDQNDKDITDMFIDLVSFLPPGVSFKFLRCDNKEKKI